MKRFLRILPVLLGAVLLLAAPQLVRAENYTFKSVSLKKISRPGVIGTLTESKANMSFDHPQFRLGTAEMEYVSFTIKEIGWAGFEKKYYSDVNAAGGVRSTSMWIYTDKELTHRVSTNPKALLTPGTYYASVCFYGSYEYYGWFLPCSAVISSANMVILGEKEAFVRIREPKTESGRNYYVSKEPAESNNINYKAYHDYIRPDRKGYYVKTDTYYQPKYNGYKYDFSVGENSDLPVTADETYYFHIEYPYRYGTDEWAGWHFYVPITLKADLSKKLPKGYTFLTEEGEFSVLTSGSSSRTVAFVGTGTVTNYRGQVKIPDTVKKNGASYKVTEIAKNALKGKTSIQEVTIGKYVKKIGGNAFKNCTKLRTLTIGSGVTTIGENAFYGCTSLNILTIPSKVTKIGKSAFENCEALFSITIRSTKLKGDTVGGKAFRNVSNYVIVTIPKSVKSRYKQMLVKKGIPKNAEFRTN